jgi:Zn-dependent peptidase ImmA (M78 family)/transcriptional regulator with XRE-family HTH domain
MLRNRTDWKELGERVARARNASHLSQRDLATKIGIDRTALTKIESGKRGLDALELAKLAEVLKRPIDWFVSQPIQAAAGRRDARRKEVIDDSPADIALEELARDVELLQTFDLLRVDALFKPRGKVKTVEDAEATAKAFRKQVGITKGPVWELHLLAESAGLHAFSIDLDDENLDGSYLAVGNGGVAMINGRAPTGRRRFTLAHELGHHLFQDPYSDEWVVDLSVGSREKVVNAFAIHLLLPGQVAKERWTKLEGNQASRKAAILLAVEFGLSWSAICAHLYNLDMIDRQVQKRLYSEPPRRYDYLELGVSVREDLLPPSVPPRFAQAVVKAYKGHKISDARAMEMLRGTIEAGDLPERVGPPLEALQADFEPGSGR